MQGILQTERAGSRKAPSNNINSQSYHHIKSKSNGAALGNVNSGIANSAAQAQQLIEQSNTQAKHVTGSKSTSNLLSA